MDNESEIRRQDRKVRPTIAIRIVLLLGHRTNNIELLGSLYTFHMPFFRAKVYRILSKCHPFLFASIAALAQENARPQPALNRADDHCTAQLSFKMDSYPSGGKPIRVEKYEPITVGKYPIIILIHGSGGLFTRVNDDFPEKENFGERSIACHGYITLVVHYFESSNILSTGNVEYMKQQFPLWLETVRNAVGYAAKLKNADSKHIGLLGESLGAYLSLALAFTDTRIAAVSEYYGGLPDIRVRRKNLPPILIQHGDKDTVVPVTEAYKIQEFFNAHRASQEIYIYPELNHNLNTSGRAQALQRSITFFDRHLKPAIPGTNR